MLYAGIDIGSTAAKAVILSEDKSRILARHIMPSGWNSKDTAGEIFSRLTSEGYSRDDMRITATGYGRVSVPYADSTLTEITCHAKGAAFLGGNDMTVIDIGGQDTKVITLKAGRAADFVMNDKCSAGTGKFLEVIANRMGLTLQEFFAAAERGNEIRISSMCTVFAESEIVSLMGAGTPREDIARGAVASVVEKVSALVNRKNSPGGYFLTGGFCDSPLLVRRLGESLGGEVKTCSDGRYAGAIGAALLGK